MNQTCEPAPAVLSLVATPGSPHLHLVRDHPADGALCGADSTDGQVVRRTDATGCRTCLAIAVGAGHLTASTAANSFVNLRRLSRTRPTAEVRRRVGEA